MASHSARGDGDCDSFAVIVSVAELTALVGIWNSRATEGLISASVVPVRVRSEPETRELSRRRIHKISQQIPASNTSEQQSRQRTAARLASETPSVPVRWCSERVLMYSSAARAVRS